MKKVLFCSFVLSSLVVISACTSATTLPTDLPANAGRDPDSLLVVDLESALVDLEYES